MTLCLSHRLLNMFTCAFTEHPITVSQRIQGGMFPVWRKKDKSHIPHPEKVALLYNVIAWNINPRTAVTRARKCRHNHDPAVPLYSSQVKDTWEKSNRDQLLKHRPEQSTVLHSQRKTGVRHRSASFTGCLTQFNPSAHRERPGCEGLFRTANRTGEQGPDLDGINPGLLTTKTSWMTLLLPPFQISSPLSFAGFVSIVLPAAM